MRLIAGALVALVLLAPPVHAQEPGTTTTLTGLPSQDIVPRPNTGEEPDDAGDRGGALQLAVLGLVVVGVGGVAAMVVRQSRRAREG